MPAKSFVDFHNIRRAVPITRILAHYHLDAELKRTQNRLTGCCPIHGSSGKNNRQFVVDLDRNVWHCFACERGGGALELVADLEKIDVRVAAELIAKIFVLTPPADTNAAQERSSRMSDAPSHRVYVVEDRDPDTPETPENKNGFWTRVGSGWKHGDNKGINIVIAPGIAVSGRIVLREVAPEDAATETEQRKKWRKK